MTGWTVTAMCGRCAQAGAAIASRTETMTARMSEPQRQAGAEGEPIRCEPVGEYEIELHEWAQADGGRDPELGAEAELHAKLVVAAVGARLIANRAGSLGVEVAEMEIEVRRHELHDLEADA